MTRTRLSALLAAVTLAPVLPPMAALAQDAALPAAIAGLDLAAADIRSERDGRGLTVTGRLPSGALIEIDLHADGGLDEIEARGRDPFLAAEIAALLPAAVIASPDWPADAWLDSLDFEDDGRIEIEGRLADGAEFDAEFAPDGRLLDFDRD